MQRWQMKLAVKAEELGIIETYGDLLPNSTASRAMVF